MFGALFSSRITELLGQVADLDLTPEMISHAAECCSRSSTADAFSDAITRVFLFAVPLLLVVFVLTWFLKETPLRTVVGSGAPRVAFDMEFAEESLGAFESIPRWSTTTCRRRTGLRSRPKPGAP